MFIELTIIYPFKNTHQKISQLLKKQREDLLSSKKCIKYSIYNDTYLNKIIYIIIINYKKHMSFIYKMFCKIGYHVKTRLVEVTLGFGPSGKVEKIQCEICKKIYIRRNTSTN